MPLRCPATSSSTAIASASATTSASRASYGGGTSYAAELYLSGRETAVARACELYGAPLDERLWRGFAGAEILRRLLGVAQLPLASGADWPALLALGRGLVVGGSEDGRGVLT